jgi:uncharacterized RDD family membrane protein YckC
MTIAEGGSGRELFWLRVTAGGIDVLAGVVAATLAAVLIYAATDGAWRSSTPFKVARCQPLSALSIKVLEGVAVPPGARPVAAQVCTVHLLGFETGRYAQVALQSQDGEVTRRLSFSRPVDRKGEPVAPAVLDWAYPLAFILAMAVWEGLTGGTLGKRLVGLKVVAADGGGRLGVARALVRNLVIFGGAALLILAPLAAALAHVRLAPTAYYAAVGVLGLLVLAPFAMLAEANARPLYDRWAGADVVRS